FALDRVQLACDFVGLRGAGVALLQRDERTRQLANPLQRTGTEARQNRFEATVHAAPLPPSIRKRPTNSERRSASTLSYCPEERVCCAPATDWLSSPVISCMLRETCSVAERCCCVTSVICRADSVVLS